MSIAVDVEAIDRRLNEGAEAYQRLIFEAYQLIAQAATVDDVVGLLRCAGRLQGDAIALEAWLAARDRARGQEREITNGQTIGP